VGNNRVKEKRGPEILPIAFMDNMNILLPIPEEDVKWYLKQVTTLGAPVGVIIGKTKTKNLTYIQGISILEYLLCNQKDWWQMYDRSLNFRLLPIGKPHISIHVY
jgi:hypothetical protein